MKESSINESVNFELTRMKIKDLIHNNSSSISHDLSISFEKPIHEIFDSKYSLEKITKLRLNRKPIPSDIK